MTDYERRLRIYAHDSARELRDEEIADIESEAGCIMPIARGIEVDQCKRVGQIRKIKALGTGKKIKL